MSAAIATRRNFIAGALAIGICAATAKTAAPAVALGVQLWMVKDALRANPQAVLGAISGAGFGAVELAGWPPVSDGDFRLLVAAADLSCRSAHLPSLFGTTDEIRRMIDRAAALDLKEIYAPLPGFRGIDGIDPAKRIAALVAHPMRADDWLWNAERLTAIAALAAPSGIRIGYHNHNMEFENFGTGRSPFELLLEHSDRRTVGFQLDLGNARLAGVDPGDLLDRFPGRFDSAHLKEWQPFAPRFGRDYPPSADFDSGTRDWSAELKLLGISGIRSAYIEREAVMTEAQIEEITKAGKFFQAIQ